jgi:hypothetical protein
MRVFVPWSMNSTRVIVGSCIPTCGIGSERRTISAGSTSDDLIADRELGAAIALNHRELVAPAQVEMDPIARRVKVRGAVPRRHLVGVGPCLKHSLARRRRCE